MSASRSCCQVFLGRPLFRLPWGFHFSACLVTLAGGLRNVCPIQPHLLFLMSSSMGSWPVLCQRLVLLMVSGQQIWRILLRQLFMKVCTLQVVVLFTLHVSAPYSKTDFTLELNIRILVFKDSSLEVHIFFSWMKAALAFLILALTSTTVPSCWSMMLPR